MNVLRDEWTPLFQKLEQRVNSSGRRALLTEMITDVHSVTFSNFGASGENRPAEWDALSEKYGSRIHRNYATLELDDLERAILKKSGPHLIESFVFDVGDNFASLINVSPYASEHQEGDASRNIPARPYFPVNPDGTLTDYMEARLAGIVESHFQV